MARNFRYTANNLTLTNDQRQFYETHGYILIKNNLSKHVADEVCKRFLDICDDKVEHGVTTIMKDPSLKNKGVKGEYLINKIQDFLYDDILWKYCSDKSVVNIVESIIGPNITAVHSMFINKPPDSDPGSSLHPLHQDLHYFPFRPADRIVASWTALETVDESNGCLYVIPGSHKGDLYKHEYPKGFKNKLYHGVHGFENYPKVNVIMEKGDTVFFHPVLLHGSGPNLTKGFRKAISCHYADSNCYFIDVQGTFQENIAKEVEAIASKKSGSTIHFVDLWKMKSRLVRGQPGNFQKLSHL